MSPQRLQVREDEAYGIGGCRGIVLGSLLALTFWSAIGMVVAILWWALS